MRRPLASLLFALAALPALAQEPLPPGLSGPQKLAALVQRVSQGNRFYFGVTDDGIRGAWKGLVGSEDERE